MQNNHCTRRVHGKRLNRPLMDQLQAKMGPVPSQQQQMDAMKDAPPRPYGGYSGCGYQGGDVGIVCQRNMNRYTPDTNFWTGDWTSNVKVQFPAPILEVVGPNQLLNGGGSDYAGNVCTESCKCTVANPDCECSSTTPQCGWASVNHDCMGAIPGGQYRSLAECESAQYSGSF